MMNMMKVTMMMMMTLLAPDNKNLCVSVSLELDGCDDDTHHGRGTRWMLQQLLPSKRHTHTHTQAHTHTEEKRMMMV